MQNNDAGSVYVVKHDGEGNFTEETVLTAFDGNQKYFGSSLDVSGNLILVGAGGLFSSSAGAAYLFTREGSDWDDGIKLIPKNPPGETDRYSYAVAVEADRGYAIVGAPLDDIQGTNSGSIYIFNRDDVTGNWSEGIVFNSSEFVDRGDEFGYALAAKGNYALVGAPNDDDSASGAGAVYVLKRDALGGWTVSQKLVATDGEPGDDFGASVAFNGNTALVGAPRNDDDGTWSGSTYIFKLLPSGMFGEGLKIRAYDAKRRDEFGFAVALSDNFALMGSREEYAHIFDLSKIS